MKTSNLFYLFLALLISACSSDDNGGDTNAEPTPQELLIGKWYLVGGTNGSGEVNLEDCQYDSFIEFLTEDDLLMEWYDTSCDTSGMQTLTYTFQTGPNGISISGNTDIGANPQFEIGKLTETELIFLFVGSTQGSMIWEREN